MKDYREIYHEYFSYSKRAYYDKIRYYETNPDIKKLDPRDKIELDIDYVICLFEVGKYHKFVRDVNRVIEDVVIENVFEYEGDNIYEKLLFLKAAAYFNIEDHLKCVELASTLRRINKNYPLVDFLIRRSKIRYYKNKFNIFSRIAKYLGLGKLPF